MAVLTVDEARARAAQLSTASYLIELDLTSGTDSFGSTTTIRFSAVPDAGDTWVEFEPTTLRRARLNGTDLDPASLVENRLPLPGEQLRADNTLVVEATIDFSRDGEGLVLTHDPEDDRDYIYAMSSETSAPRWFACFDQPDLKAAFDLHVSAPEDWTLVANAPVSRQEPGRWEFQTTPPISTYLVTLIAGPYHSIFREHDGLRLAWHCRAALAPVLERDADELFDVTARCLDAFHELFGIRYPFGEYHQVFCPDYVAGAMENPGCVTFHEDFLPRGRATLADREERVEVISHEMAHMWFGDLVTMRWWDDIWLNESFADFAGYWVADLASPFENHALNQTAREKTFGLWADSRRSTHPVAGNGAADVNEALNNFDGISYTKGCAVLGQLCRYLGEDAFFEGVRRHLREHAYGNATMADLIGAWERVSGRDLTEWTHAWLGTAGVDTLTLTEQTGVPTLVRTASSTPPALRPHSFTAAWFPAVGREPVEIPVDLDAASVALHFPGYDRSGFVVPDRDDAAWATIVLPDDAPVAEYLPTIASAGTRSAIAASLRDAVRDGRLAPSEFLSISEQWLPREPHDTLLTGWLDRVTRWHGSFLPAGLAERIATMLSAMLDGAEPGSNRQLVLAQGLISFGPAQVSTWLAGPAPAGLEVDQDLRWRLIRSQCTAGLADQSLIDAESAADSSLAAHLHALTATTSLPDPAAKAVAWERFVGDAELTVDEVLAVARGFFRPGQDELWSDYVPRYVAEFPRTSQFRGDGAVELSASQGFPRPAVNEHTVGLVEQAIADSALSPRLRRRWSDESDELQRALASRRRFPPA